MLTILRKHQKILLVAVAAIVVLSFSLFGTFDVLMRQNEEGSRTLCKSLTKRALKEEDVLALTHLLTHSPYAWGKELSLLQDGVIERDFLSSGIGAFLAEKYKSVLREDLKERIEKLHAFSLYEHRVHPKISLASTWKRFAPSLLLQLQEIKRQKDIETHNFRELVDLYLSALQCPAERARHILFAEQEKQQIEQDPMLVQAQLSPGGFSSYVDWFGSKWLHIVSQCIVNAADVAEKRGIEVSRKEAKQDLYRHFSLQLAQVRRNVEREQMVQEFQNACVQLGLNDQQLIESWRKVLLFRKLLDTAADGMLLENLPFAQFSAFANDHASVELYSIPDPMPFSDLAGLARWQIYAEVVAGSDPKAMTLRTVPWEKVPSSLMVQTYDITYAEVPRESVAYAFSLKEMWQWASQDAHWEKFLAQFPELAERGAKTEQDRFRILVECNAEERIAIDKAIQRAMLEKSGNIERALDTASTKTATLLFGEKTFVQPFSGIIDSRALLDLLEHKDAEALRCFTFDGDVYYRIDVSSIAKNKRMLDFQEAEQILDQWLEQRLEKAYPGLRKRDPMQFRTASGEERPIIEVKEELIRFVYAPLLERIEKEYERVYGALPGKFPAQYYVRYYALSAMQAARDALSAQKETALDLKQEVLDISRKEGKFYQEGMRTDTPWSPILHDPKRGLVFFRVLESHSGNQDAHQGAWLVRKTLQNEAKREWAKTLIEEMKKQGAIVVF